MDSVFRLVQGTLKNNIRKHPNFEYSGTSNYQYINDKIILYKTYKCIYYYCRWDSSRKC